jgi:N-acyl-D-amino-acid deacylase
LKSVGSIAVGNFADLVIFNPDTITDKATFEDAHQYAEGVVHVFVNGVQVLNNGNYTGAMPGKMCAWAGVDFGKWPKHDLN